MTSNLMTTMLKSWLHLIELGALMKSSYFTVARAEEFMHPLGCLLPCPSDDGTHPWEPDVESEQSDDAKSEHRAHHHTRTPSL